MMVFKFIFGYIGFKYALSVGANPLAGLIVGIITGHILDIIANMKWQRWRANRYYSAQAKKAAELQFLNSLFLMCGQLSAVDGAVTKDEVQVVERIMGEVLRLDRRARRKAIEIFKQARTSPLPFQTNAVRYFELYRSYPDVLENTIQLLFQLAVADGLLSPDEERLIHAAATVFGLDDGVYRQLKRAYVKSQTDEGQGGTVTTEVERSYAILGCQKSDTNDVIKQNYRKLATQFHPDKIAAKGLPEEFLRFATQKFQDIQGAYEILKSDRGFN